jgi:DnaJ-domain-containing protein 1
MTDYFALLGEPRRPWLDPEQLRTGFLERSSRMHPDRVHEEAAETREAAGDAFIELNAAYQCLREPRDRIAHLLVLETGMKPKEVQEITPATMNLFLEIGRACKEADHFLAERERVTSPVLKAQQYQKGVPWVDRLQKLQDSLRAEGQKREDDLKGLNRFWEAPEEPTPALPRPPLPLRELEAIYRDLSYLRRWSQQVNERLIRLFS